MSSPTTKKEWIIKKESELRCEVREQPLSVRLVQGNAEVFGVELAMGKTYVFRDQNIAIFTWYGCKIETEGDCYIYESDSTPMVAYANTHIQLEARRDFALGSGERGPHVLIVGPPDHGKSTLARILTSYAVRLDRSPVYVDLDVGGGVAGVPGSIAAMPIDKTHLSAEEGFANFNSLVYFYGHASPKDHPDLYKAMCSVLAAKVHSRLSHDADAKASGIIVDSCGYMDWTGLDQLLACIKDFKIDIVLVMGYDRLHASLHAAFASNTDGVKPIIVNLPVSGGRVQRDPATRKRLRKLKFNEYFYGKIQDNTMSLQPERMDGLDISQFTFLRCGGMQISEGMRSVGDKASPEDAYKISKIGRITTELEKSVVAVLHTPSADGPPLKPGEVSQQFLQSNVAGFIYILKIDVDNNTMDVLSPCPGQLPSKNLLVGSMKWTE